MVHPLGIPVDPRSFWSYAIGVSVGAQVLFLPVIGALADFGRHKKRILAMTAYLGASDTAALFFIHGRHYLAGGVLFIVANVSFGAAEAIYNSFLPEIAPPEQRDAVSSKGWAIGYLGGGLLLALNVILYMKAAALGIGEAMAVRISLSSAGVWWAVFTIPTLLALRDRGPRARASPRTVRAQRGGASTGAHPSRRAALSPGPYLPDRILAIQRRYFNRAGRGRPVRQR